MERKEITLDQKFNPNEYDSLGYMVDAIVRDSLSQIIYQLGYPNIPITSPGLQQGIDDILVKLFIQQERGKREVLRDYLNNKISIENLLKKFHLSLEDEVVLLLEDSRQTI